MIVATNNIEIIDCKCVEFIVFPYIDEMVDSFLPCRKFGFVTEPGIGLPSLKERF